MNSEVPVKPPSTTPAVISDDDGKLRHRVSDSLSLAYRPIIRTAGVISGLIAFGAAFGAILTDLTGSLLVASGGFGALAFGAAGVLTQLAEREASLRKARALAHLARRSLVEMLNKADGACMARWIGEIGTSASLDAVEKLLRDLLDATAVIGGWRANSAEVALFAFFRAANHINPLYVRIPDVGDFKKEDLARKGKILGGLIGAVRALSTISRPETDEPTVKSKLLTLTEVLDEVYGGVEL